MIEVINLTKKFPDSATNRTSLKKALLSLPKRIINKDITEKTSRSGLNNISFNVNRGEILGVIGRNGSGKSTLAKILAGVSFPTLGEVKINGRVAGLLELGAGFHPELSARENIYLNGMLLGLTKKEISQRVEEILDFAGLTERQNEPIRTFSTGMQMRLGYSIATHVSADILIIDEALAVGDEEFQEKCKDHLLFLKNQGVTMIVITHDLGFIEKECTSALLLNYGDMICYGNVDETLKVYKDLII